MARTGTRRSTRPGTPDGAPVSTPVSTRAGARASSSTAGPARAPAPGERGSVTAETAMALPALVVVLLLAVWVLLCVAAQLRCVDAAHMGARAAARGETDTVVAGTAQRVAPEGARVIVRRADGQVEVAVEASVQPFSAVLRLLPSILLGRSHHHR